MIPSQPSFISDPSGRPWRASATEVGPDRAVTLPVIAEQVQVDIVREDTGVVRIRKEVHHDSQAVAAGGFRDTVETRRVAVGRIVDAAQEPHRRDGVLVIPVYEERLVRQLFLVEEIHVVQRREFDPEEPHAVELRREEIVVERFDSESGHWRPDTG